MPQYFANLFVSDELAKSSDQRNFWYDGELLLFASDDGADYLNKLTSKICRKYKDLLTHLRRIYFCYQKSMPEHLYAALVDLFIVLNGKGKVIRQRLLEGCRSALDDEQFNSLKNAGATPLKLKGNRYSLFANGVFGTLSLVEFRRQTREKHDFLALANDFIEYSQLDQAMDTLEIGIVEDPDRTELQDALLDIYKSTGSKERFQKQYQLWSAAGAPLIDRWRVLADFFSVRLV